MFVSATAGAASRTGRLQLRRDAACPVRFQLRDSTIPPFLHEFTQCILPYKQSRLVVDPDWIERRGPAARNGAVLAPVFPPLRPAEGDSLQLLHKEARLRAPSDLDPPRVGERWWASLTPVGW